LEYLRKLLGRRESKRYGTFLDHKELSVSIKEFFSIEHDFSQELDYCERMILTITEEQGVRLLIDELLGHTKTDKIDLKRASVKLLSIFCIHTKADIEPYIAQLIRGLIQLMTENDEAILLLAADGLSAVVKVGFIGLKLPSR
jgi:hypothetical protein